MTLQQGKVPLCRAGHELATPGGYCRLCAVCSICDTPLLVSEYEFCLRQNARLQKAEDDALLPGEERRLVDLKFSHPHCLSETEKAILQTETVTIPRSLFDKLNATRLLLEPLEDFNGKTNADDATQHLDRWIYESGKTRTFEEHQNWVFLLVRRAEAIAAFSNLALSKTRKGLAEDHLKRDRDRFQIALAERKEHENRAPRTEARHLTKEERAIEKMAKVLQGLGYSETEALTEAKFKIQGKRTIQ